MKIQPQLQEKFAIFCRNYSSDIEYDSIIKYVQRLSLFLEVKIDEEQKLHSKKNKNNEICKNVIKANIKQALTNCDVNGITTNQQRIAIEILSKYWLYGDFLQEIKTSL